MFPGGRDGAIAPPAGGVQGGRCGAVAVSVVAYAVVPVGWACGGGAGTVAGRLPSPRCATVPCEGFLPAAAVLLAWKQIMINNTNS